MQQPHLGQRLAKHVVEAVARKLCRQCKSLQQSVHQPFHQAIIVEYLFTECRQIGRPLISAVQWLALPDVHIIRTEFHTNIEGLQQVPWAIHVPAQYADRKIAPVIWRIDQVNSVPLGLGEREKALARLENVLHFVTWNAVIADVKKSHMLARVADSGDNLLLLRVLAAKRLNVDNWNLAEIRGPADFDGALARKLSA